MNMTRSLIFTSLALMLSAGISVTDIHASGEAVTEKAKITAVEAGELYIPSKDAMADLKTGFDTAQGSNKLALVVMGANWCHDSRALAARLFKEPLSTVIDAHYEVIFIDVGYLENGKEVISSLGIPVYYATPTVLIVDPLSREVLNADDRNQWGNAYKISMKESVDYFAQYAETGQSTTQSDGEPDENLQVLIANIKAFEDVQAARLYEAYAVLTPMIKAYKEGDEKAFSEKIWNEVRDYRFKVSEDVVVLRAEARERVAAGETDIRLSYPDYPAFSWDMK
jgi:hypothetical protein